MGQGDFCRGTFRAQMRRGLRPGILVQSFGSIIFVLGFVETLAEPDRDGLLLGERGCSGVKQPDRSDRE